MRMCIGHAFATFSFGDQRSQAEARLALKKSRDSFVVIFAHGGSSYIRGGEYVHRVTREPVVSENFLSVQDMNMFRGKVIFCLSCGSNGLASAALDAGAQAFVGFDDVPFNRYDASGEQISNHEFEQHTQQLIANAVMATIERFVTGRSALDEAVAFMRLFICQSAVHFVRKYTKLKQRREIAALLLRLELGVRYHGTRSVMFAK